MSDIQAGDGWIEWEGGECPVAPNARVQLKIAPGHRGSRAYRASEVQWDNSKRQVLLLAYRVVQS